MHGARKRVGGSIRGRALFALLGLAVLAAPAAGFEFYPVFRAAPVPLDEAECARIVKAFGLSGAGAAAPVETRRGVEYRGATASLRFNSRGRRTALSYAYRVVAPPPSALPRPLPPDRAAAAARRFLVERGLLPDDAAPAFITEPGDEQGTTPAIVAFSPAALPAPAPREGIQVFVDRRTGVVTAINWHWFKAFEEIDGGVARCPEEVRALYGPSPARLLEDAVQYKQLALGGLDPKEPTRVDAVFVPGYQLGLTVRDRVEIYPRFDPVQPVVVPGH